MHHFSHSVDFKCHRLPDREAISALLNKVSDHSLLPIDLSTAKLDPASGKMAESSRSQQRKRNSEGSLSPSGNSCFQTFCEMVSSRKCTKTLQTTLLVLATIGTACFCSLPTVIYFTAKVSD